jgi:acetyl-CoA carboxylase carboxyltransferase component
VVPKFTIITGNSFGAGNYAMCGKAYDPRFIVSWPWAELAVMGGSQAAKVLVQIQESTLKKQGKEITTEEHNELVEKITQNYTKQTKVEYSAARIWVDAIINPLDTRKWISAGIESANHSPITDKFNLGVIQV